MRHIPIDSEQAHTVILWLHPAQMVDNRPALRDVSMVIKNRITQQD